jgi:electron transport complex protein RnfE
MTGGTRGKRVLQEFTKGLFKKNPIFVLMVGLCPTLATSVSVESAFWMGIAATVVVVSSNVIISMVRNFIPAGVRIPCYIVIIASFVTMVELLMKGFLSPELNRTLGIFVPLIVVNCIILYRAEDFASKNGVLASMLDGLGMGCGFLLAILLLGTIRESIGAGTLWGYRLLPGYEPLRIMVLAPGAFALIGLLMAYFQLPKKTQHRILLWVFLLPIMTVVQLVRSARRRLAEQAPATGS